MENNFLSKWVSRWTTGIGCLLLLSCTQSELREDLFPASNERQLVEITAEIMGPGTRGMTDMNEVLGSGQFVDGNIIGLYVQEQGASDYKCHNESYILNNQRWGPANNPSDSLFWNVIGIKNPHTFSAHYPKLTVSKPTTVCDFEVAADQTGEGYGGSDLLFATNQAQGERVNLRFNHLMSRLIIQVMSDSITSVKVKHLHRGCTVDLTTGIVTGPIDAASSALNVPDIEPHKWANSSLSSSLVPAGTKSVYEVVIPSQKLTNTQTNRLALLEITTSLGTTIIANAPLKVTNINDAEENFTSFTSNKQTLLQLNLVQEQVVISSTSVMPWGIGGTEDIGNRPHAGIYTAEDLVNLSREWNETGKLSAASQQKYVTYGMILFWRDILFDAASNAAFSPIGDNVHRYEGPPIDGQNHTIRNLKINSTGEFNAAGLFGAVGNRAMSNLHFENCEVISESKAGTGMLAGYLATGAINNCTVRDCHIEGVTSVGGLIANRAGTSSTSFCNVKNTLVRGNSRVGGLFGDFSSYVNDCWTDCTVEGVSQVGGFIGSATYNRSFECIANCYSLGTVKGDTQVGGFIGLGGTTTYNCYSATRVISSSPTTGSYIGQLKEPDLSRPTLLIRHSHAIFIPGMTTIGTTMPGRTENVYAFNPVTGQFTGQPADYPKTLLEALKKYRTSDSKTYADWMNTWVKYVDPNSGRPTESSLPTFY